MTIAVFQDGVAVPGSTNTEQATAGNVVSLPLVRVRCGAASNLSVVLVNGAGTIANVAVKVLKV